MLSAIPSAIAAVFLYLCVVRIGKKMWAGGDQSALSFPATIILRDQPVNVTETIESRGGINDFRLAVAYRLGQRWVVGAGAHIITRSNRVEARRTFSDTLYARSVQRAELSFAGFGVSLGRLESVSESAAVIPMPQHESFALARGGGADVPVQPGELTVRADVTARYRIEGG